jgi:hypothetical protein
MIASIWKRVEGINKEYATQQGLTSMLTLRNNIIPREMK